MDKLRLRFEKTGKAVYISHLDLMRVVQRVFVRAGVPLRYSEGYNPHALISICLPLPVGTASLCELMDFRVTEDIDLPSLPERLNAVSPAGVRFLECYEPSRKAAGLKWLEIRGDWEYDGRAASQFSAGVEEFFNSGNIPVTRRTKRGEGEFDLAAHMRGFAVEAAEGETLAVRAFVSAQEPTVKPELLPEALRELVPELAPDFARFTRLETYGADMEIFR